MSASIEIRQLMEMTDASGQALTALAVVEASKDKDKWPNLHKHLWEASEPELAMEARLSRVHRLLIQLRVTTEEGVSTRLAVHTSGYAGYRPLESVLTNRNFAASKLLELTQDIARARARLRAFRAVIPADVAEDIDEALQRAERMAADVAPATEAQPAA